MTDEPDLERKIGRLAIAAHKANLESLADARLGANHGAAQRQALDLALFRAFPPAKRAPLPAIDIEKVEDMAIRQAARAYLASGRAIPEGYMTSPAELELYLIVVGFAPDRWREKKI